LLFSKEVLVCCKWNVYTLQAPLKNLILMNMSDLILHSVVRKENEQYICSTRDEDCKKKLFIASIVNIVLRRGIVCIDWCCSSLPTYRDRPRHRRRPFWTHRLPAESRGSTYALMTSWQLCFHDLTLTAIGIRRADHKTLFNHKSWHWLRQQMAVARSV
jgi:hypothetical protein